MSHDQTHSTEAALVRSARASRWRLARACAAECAGGALLVCGACLPAPARAGPLAAAVTAGALIAMLVQCFDHISGAFFNPAVTAAAAVAGRLRWGAAGALAAAQLSGAAAGAALLWALAGQPELAVQLCVTRPADHISPFKAACVEALAAGCLSLASCASWDARNARLLDAWPLRIGATVTALTLVAGELTGASMNPARSFGPALLAADFRHLWIYFVGPMSGALCASLLYRVVWRAPGGAARGDTCAHTHAHKHPHPI